MPAARTTTNISSQPCGRRRDTPTAAAAVSERPVFQEGSRPDPEPGVPGTVGIPGQAAAVFIKRSQRRSGEGISLTGNHWLACPLGAGPPLLVTLGSCSRCSHQRLEEAPNHHYRVGRRWSGRLEPGRRAVSTVGPWTSSPAHCVCRAATAPSESTSNSPLPSARSGPCGRWGSSRRRYRRRTIHQLRERDPAAFAAYRRGVHLLPPRPEKDR